MLHLSKAKILGHCCLFYVAWFCRWFFVKTLIQKKFVSRHTICFSLFGKKKNTQIVSIYLFKNISKYSKISSAISSLSCLLVTLFVAHVTDCLFVYQIVHRFILGLFVCLTLIAYIKCNRVCWMLLLWGAYIILFALSGEFQFHLRINTAMINYFSSFLPAKYSFTRIYTYQQKFRI